MSLKQTKSRGFTIVELLIVIVVIAILAAITIVAYNGIQNRANTSAAQSAASNVAKKAEAYNAAGPTSSYPVSTANFNAVDESALNGTGITLATSPSASNGKTTVRYEYCIAGPTAPTTASTATGARITYFEFPSTLPLGTAAQFKLGVAAGAAQHTCTVAA